MAAPTEKMILFLFEFLAVFISVSLCVILKMEHNIIKPYMDEIFHIPQVQQYCQGNFSHVCRLFVLFTMTIQSQSVTALSRLL